MTHKKTCLKLAFLSGADGGTRTRDLFLTKEVLYLLSYISIGVPTVVFIRLCRIPRASRTSTVFAIALSKATTLLIILSRVGFVNRNAIVATRKNERRAEPPFHYSSLSSESGLPGCCSTGGATSLMSEEAPSSGAMSQVFPFVETSCRESAAEPQTSVLSATVSADCSALFFAAR